MASFCSSQSFPRDSKHIRGEKIQAQEFPHLDSEKPKINRLKRVKRSRRSDLMLPECEGITHDVTDDDGYKKNPRHLTTHGAQCSPPKRGLLFRMKISGGQKLRMNTEPDSSCHQEPSILEDEGGGQKGSHPRDLHEHEDLRHEVCAQSRYGEGVRSSSFIPKRKQEVHSDGRLCKRQKWSQYGTETVNILEGRVSFGEGTIKRNRLRRKQEPVKNVAGDDDVPWTEKYRPRSCDEVVGNSSAVKKLYSWLKEWRMRADVEERRRRREERRIKEESNGSWDCGDFEGDLQMEECDGDLCNTLLIHGPTGAGKSAAVFACAEQLGFNVLELNSSSLRSGRLVLSQLRESTQSHQVGAPHRSVSHTHTPAAASREGASQEPVWFCRKPSAKFRAASRKKRGAARKCITLARYFKKTRKEHTEPSQDTRPLDDIPRDESGCKKDGAPDENNKTSPISLVLFEEVDIVFEEDVGFLAAIKTLMSSTKRPIILTANDPAFRKSFDGRFEEISFKTPSTESMVSYLQSVCVGKGVKMDPESIRTMLLENHGDVRRSVLELEVWVRSGGGNTQRHLHNRALACRSYTELERCMEILVENWRKGRSLLYSKLNHILAPPTFTKAHQSTFEQKTKGPSPPRSRKLKDLRNVLAKQHSIPALPLDGAKHTDHSAAGGFFKVDSLACFYDTMSFLDSYLCRTRACGKPGPLGAKIADGLLDEPREDDGVELRTDVLERCYEILGVVEGLGFHRCRTEVCPMKRGDQSKTWNRVQSKQEMREIIHKALCSKAFRFHGDQTAVVTDYLPFLRFMCRENTEQQEELRCSHYLTEIGLHLPKSILNLFASQRLLWNNNNV